MEFIVNPCRIVISITFSDGFNNLENIDTIYIMANEFRIFSICNFYGLWTLDVASNVSLYDKSEFGWKDFLVKIRTKPIILVSNWGYYLLPKPVIHKLM